jgi:hypothetical protein
MRTVTTKLKSTSPYLPSRRLYSEMEAGETQAEYEKRCWREHAHINKDGHLFVPAMVLKNCVTSHVQRRLRRAGKELYCFMLHFQAGFMITDDVVLPQRIEDVTPSWHGLHNGEVRCLPHISEWEGEVNWYLLDESMSAENFLQILSVAGGSGGIGSFNPPRGHSYGCFEVVEVHESSLVSAKPVMA